MAAVSDCEPDSQGDSEPSGRTRCSERACSFQNVTVVHVTFLCHVKVCDLHQGKTYVFRVRAVNASGVGRPSDTSEPVLVEARPGEPRARCRVTDGPCVSGSAGGAAGPCVVSCGPSEGAEVSAAVGPAPRTGATGSVRALGRGTALCSGKAHRRGGVLQIAAGVRSGRLTAVGRCLGCK